MEKAHVGGVLTTRKEFKTTRSSPNSMTRLRLSPTVTATRSLVIVIWHFLIGQALVGPAFICPLAPLRRKPAWRFEAGEDHHCLTTAPDHDELNRVQYMAEY